MKPDWRFLFSHPAHFIALGFGSGLSPYAPGTAGSLAAIPLFWLLTRSGLREGLLITAIVLALLLGIWACGVAGRRLGVPDHGSIVWDEIGAMWLVLAFIPAGAGPWAVAFFVFRFFDILKPWPIRQFDARLKNGFGVMLDDVLAALYTLLVFKGLQWLA